MVTRGEGLGGRDRLGVWDWHVHTATFKIDNQQGPTVKKKKSWKFLKIKKRKTEQEDK